MNEFTLDINRVFNVLEGKYSSHDRGIGKTTATLFKMITTYRYSRQYNTYQKYLLICENRGLIESLVDNIHSLSGIIGVRLGRLDKSNLTLDNACQIRIITPNEIDSLAGLKFHEIYADLMPGTLNSHQMMILNARKY